MMKKFCALALSAAMMLSLVSCSGGSAELIEATTEDPSLVVEKEEVDQAYTTGINFIQNPDFSEGTGKWTTYFNSGGTATMAVNDQEQLEVAIDKVGAVDYGVQIYYDGFKLREGGVYTISFDIASDIERVVEWRVQINGGDYHRYAGDYIKVGPEMQTVSQDFTMNEISDPAPRLVFNMGCQEGLTPDAPAHSVYIDNLDLEVIDDTNMIQDPPPVKVPCVKVNQIGYKKKDAKVAVFSDLNESTTRFCVVNVETGKSVYAGDIVDKTSSISSDEWTYYGDFSAVKKPGTYKVVCADGESYPFVIGNDVYDDAFNESLKMFYMQRCGMELTEEYAGDFKHPICHAEEATIYGTNEKIDVSGGWHDAGDYGRYTVSGAKAVVDLLLAYQKNPKQFNDSVGIPESGNGVPDILDEAKYELDWMFKMQNDEGGVYHKVTCANFPETVMPEEETDELLVMPVSIPATGDFAATMAMAYEVYKPIDAEYAEKCLAAAEKSYEYMVAHISEPGYYNPDDVVTGEYPDPINGDEYYWAACQLYKATKDAKYYDGIKAAVDYKGLRSGEGWDNVGTYGTYAFLTTDDVKSLDEEFYQSVYDFFILEADDYVDKAITDGYNCALWRDYVWGSNMVCADAAMVCSWAYEITKDDKYKTTEKQQLDYLFGTNATGYCFLTGFGTLSPNSTHHRPSQVLEKTMPGMLVGGPNAGLDDPYAMAVLSDKKNAKCYVDNSQCFSCNEITVYWNSPLIYLMADEK